MEPEILQLLLKAEKGDRLAFRRVMDLFLPALYPVVRGIVKNDEEVKDTLQEVMIKVYRSLASLKNKSAFRTWLYRIAVNAATNRWKVQKRHSEKETILQEDTRIDFQLRPEDVLENQEIQGLIHQAIDYLPPEHQAVLVLVELEGLSCVEAAEILECPAGTVRSRLHYAKKKLYEILLPHRALLKGEEA